MTVSETAKVNNLNPIPTPYGYGDRVEVNTKLKINGDLQLNGHVVTSLNPSGSVALGSPTEPWTGIVAETEYVNWI